MERRCQLPGKPHSGRRFIRAPEQWAVLRQDCWPAYIDWDTYTRNQEQMAANRARHNGVPRGGPALLGGIIRCGQCGRRMSVGYHNNGREARYLCWQLATTFGEPRCQSVSAQPVDDFVADLIPSSSCAGSTSSWARSAICASRDARLRSLPSS